MCSKALNLSSGNKLHKESVYSRLADKTQRTRVKGNLAVPRLSGGLRAIFL